MYGLIISELMYGVIISDLPDNAWLERLSAPEEWTW